MLRVIFRHHTLCFISCLTLTLCVYSGGKKKAPEFPALAQSLFVTWQLPLCSVTPPDLGFFTCKPAFLSAPSITWLQASVFRLSQRDAAQSPPLFFVLFFIATALRCGHQALRPPPPSPFLRACVWNVKPRSVTSPTLPLPIYMMGPSSCVFIYTVACTVTDECVCDTAAPRGTSFFLLYVTQSSPALRDSSGSVH